MPTYQYECKFCGFLTEELKPIGTPKKEVCPECKKRTLIKLLGSGSGFKITGEGVYKQGWS